MDENLLQQLQSGENIHIILNPMEMQDHDLFARLNDPQAQQQQPQHSTTATTTTESSVRYVQDIENALTNHRSCLLL